ncbi:fungal-specific transcription factor domain-containing protein [Mycena sanguinolenta]|nr:fungal-specific transcription factor domain-containing protein [Mycena sanguinolenta]
MAADDHTPAVSEAHVKRRRRLRGACDICRKQKARCNSAEMPNNVCSNCIAFGSKCTHTGKAGSSSSGNDLNNNSRTAPDHIRLILSGSNEYISGDPLVVYQVLVAIAQYARRLEEAVATTTAAQSLGIQPSPLHWSSSADISDTSDETNTDLDPNLDDGIVFDSNLPESLQRIIRDVSINRFYGRSSSIHFIRAFQAAKMEATGDNNLIPQRPEFWTVRPWERPAEIFVPLLFPEPQLMVALIDKFFSEMNILIYVLHEITFRRAVDSGLHLHSQKFGEVVLAVCSLGAKFLSDRRVFLDDSDSEHTAGWLWFRQVRPVPTSLSLCGPASLYEIQLVLLSVLYLASASMPEQTYLLVGLGLRMAYDIGAHSRVRAKHGGDNVEAEQYKRVFLVLLCSDTIMSSLLGRPRSAQMNEMDIDLPVPLEGEPPIVTVYASLLLKLMEIWGRIQDEIYPHKRKDQNYQGIVAELDSALNEWVGNVPDQLRWDPNRQDLTTLNQSACLYGTYYHVQILLHRPFIPSPGNHTSPYSISFPSLAISANAARSCAHVMDVQSKRCVGPLYNPQIISALFDCALVLLMNVFHRSRPSADQSVQKCLNVLKVYERRWQVAGRNTDILAGMLAGILENSEPSSMMPSLKRPRSSEDTSTASTIPEPDAFNSEELYSGRVSVCSNAHLATVTQDIEQLQVSETDSSQQEIERLLFLPLYTEDLGRLPVYEPFDLDSIFRTDLTNAPFENNWEGWGTYVPNNPN